jgi:phospholipid-binding lipoprotein MlaA
MELLAVTNQENMTNHFMNKTITAALLLSLSAPMTSAWAVETLDPVVVIASPEAELESDPLENYNRAIFEFNESFDNNLMKPVAEGYREIMPDPAERGVSNFFSNLREPFNILNNLLQFKLEDAVSDTVRFGINTTIGIFGIFDVASEAGIPKHNEDLGQTLAVWGVDSGPYFVLPLFGPSTMRDTAGIASEMWIGNTVEVGNTQLFNPTGEITPANAENATIATKMVSKRADLLEEKEMADAASFDNYAFIRDAYLQKRESLIFDGNVPLQELPADF